MATTASVAAMSGEATFLIIWWAWLLLCSYVPKWWMWLLFYSFSIVCLATGQFGRAIHQATEEGGWYLLGCWILMIVLCYQADTLREALRARRVRMNGQNQGITPRRQCCGNSMAKRCTSPRSRTISGQPSSTERGIRQPSAFQSGPTQSSGP
jgi:hypothetical protein